MPKVFRALQQHHTYHYCGFGQGDLAMSILSPGLCYHAATVTMITTYASCIFLMA